MVIQTEGENKEHLAIVRSEELPLEPENGKVTMDRILTSWAPITTVTQFDDLGAVW